MGDGVVSAGVVGAVGVSAGVGVGPSVLDTISEDISIVKLRNANRIITNRCEKYKSSSDQPEQRR